MAPFVLIHRAMHGGCCWQRVVPRLRAAGQAVFTPTLFRLGERINPAHPGIDLETQIQDVLGLLDDEDLRDVLLVGHSYGAVVITGVAERRLARVAQVALLDGAMHADGQAVLDCFRPDRCPV